MQRSLLRIKNIVLQFINLWLLYIVRPILTLEVLLLKVIINRKFYGFYLCFCFVGLYSSNPFVHLGFFVIYFYLSGIAITLFVYENVPFLRSILQKLFADGVWKEIYGEISFKNSRSRLLMVYGPLFVMIFVDQLTMLLYTQTHKESLRLMGEALVLVHEQEWPAHIKQQIKLELLKQISITVGKVYNGQGILKYLAGILGI